MARIAESLIMDFEGAPVFMQHSQANKFAPLLGALKQMQFWLNNDNPPQVMLAAPTLNDFLHQNSSTCNTVHGVKLHGSRVPVRGRRISRENTRAYAHWPQDNLVEGIRSMLTVVLRGNPVLRVADYQVHCKPGDILFTPGHLPRWNGVLLLENEKHQRQCELASFFGGAPDITHVSLRISRYHSERLVPLREGETCWLKSHVMGQIFSGLEEYLQQDHQNKNAIQFIKLHTTLFIEAIESGHVLDTQAYPSDSLLMQRKEPIEHAHEYVRNHLDRNLSVNVLANWVGMSRSTFTRHFRAKTGQSFTAFLIEQRLEQAKVLLVNTDFPIVRIGELVGLKPWRLRELFREKFHCTPTQFRKSQK